MARPLVLLETHSGVIWRISSLGKLCLLCRHGPSWCILSEELLIGDSRIVELAMVVDGSIEELSVRRVHLVIVLTELNIEVADPTELAVDVSFFGDFSVVRHTCPLNLVFLEWVELALRRLHCTLLRLEVFVEVLLCAQTEESIRFIKEEASK